MLKLLHKCIFILLLSITACAYADNGEMGNELYLDKTKLVLQQNDLLKNRLIQAKRQLSILQKQEDHSHTLLSSDRVSKSLLNQITLDIAVAKSNLESIDIELSESQQVILGLEKDIQEIQNQLNIYTMFGSHIARAGSSDLARMQMELSYQKELLVLEKKRAVYLSELQNNADNVLQLYRAKYTRIDSLLKSQSIMHIKEQQEKSEIGLQQQQSYWMKQAAMLNAELNHLQKNKMDDVAYNHLQNEIFYANEHVNFTYIQMLIARYKEQIKQVNISLSHSSSITLLNKMSDQAQSLSKQLSRVSDLLNERVDIIQKRGALFNQVSGEVSNPALKDLLYQYQSAIHTVSDVNKDLSGVRLTLDHVLQQELSARQGLPGFGSKAWLDLGGEFLLVPTLTMQVFKSLTYAIIKLSRDISLAGWLFLAFLQITWWSVYGGLRYFLRRIVSGMSDHELGHINLKWLTIRLALRSLLDVAFMGNLILFFSYLAIPSQNYSFLLNVALVWIIFKMIITLAHLCLIESVHDREGQDERLYHRLRNIFLVGGVITAVSVIIHQLPVMYELKDLFDRFFLLFLLVAMLFLLRQWNLLPGLILPHIDERRTYLRRIVILMGFLIPIVLLVNSVIGLFGYVNLIMTISWYESIFILLMIGYLVLRGLLNDGMELASKMLIRHVTNGWLWTEAFLKPVDKVLRIILFLSAWATLFLLYGWDQQSPVVERLNNLLHFRLIEVLNIPVTPWSLMEVTVMVALLYWSARWTREFVYRMLLSRTKDMGFRNSIAILSQYAMILIGLLISLRLLGIDIRALAVVATALAFGVGLGLRDLVNNFACGFLLLIERPLRVGDVVNINGNEGEVTNIGSRAVTIRTWDHMDVIVPNAEIFSKSFINWTGKDNIVRSVISIKLNRHDNPLYVQKLIHEVLDKHKEVLKDPVPEVFLKELTDGLMEFELRYHINFRQVKSRIGLRSEILMAIWETFEKNNIQPPYPHHEIFVKANLPNLI